MIEPWNSQQAITPEGDPGATDEPTVAPEAAPVLAAVGILALTRKVANPWTLVGTVALVALGVAAVVVRRWRAPVRPGG